MQIRPVGYNYTNQKAQTNNQQQSFGELIPDRRTTGLIRRALSLGGDNLGKLGTFTKAVERADRIPTNVHVRCDGGKCEMKVDGLPVQTIAETTQEVETHPATFLTKISEGLNTAEGIFADFI